jgi:hypothetical protein
MYELANDLYQDVGSKQIFTSIGGLSKMLSLSNYWEAKRILFSLSHQTLKQGMFAGIVKSAKGILKDLLTKMLLWHSTCNLETWLTLAQAWELTICPGTYGLLKLYVSSHLVAKIILDSGTANASAKSLAVSLLLTDSISQSEELLRAIDEASPKVVPHWMQAFAY